MVVELKEVIEKATTKKKDTSQWSKRDKKEK
jgi:hypothetical protein